MGFSELPGRTDFFLSQSNMVRTSLSAVIARSRQRSVDRNILQWCRGKRRLAGRQSLGTLA